MLVVSRIASGQGIEFDAICSALVALGLEPSLIFDVSRRFAVVPEDFMVSEQELFDHILGLGGRVEEFELKDHTEVATLVNSAANQTFRRSALPLRQGQPRAFTLDAWTVPEIASAVAPQQNISLSTLAMFAYNCGVLLLLAGPDHKVVIRAS